MCISSKSGGSGTPCWWRIISSQVRTPEKESPRLWESRTLS
ncbi:MAG: hypothetical protein GYA56_11280 [Geobacteraceae bacterium]|nr:hypothetical protein [Geobacteraceae bacterium]